MILDIGLKLDASTPPLAFISSMACFIPWLITMLVILVLPVMASRAPMWIMSGSFGFSAASAADVQ
jgi:hypothetical protein